jgi:hypothetical protein
MSDALREDRDLPFTPRVIEMEAPDASMPFFVAPPQVIVTDRAAPVVPSERSVIAAPPEPARRRNRVGWPSTLPPGFQRRLSGVLSWVLSQRRRLRPGWPGLAR